MWAPGSRLWEPRPALVSLSFPALVCQVSAFTLHAWPGLNLQWKAQPLHPVAFRDGAGRGQGGAASAWVIPRAASTREPLCRPSRTVLHP